MSADKLRQAAKVLRERAEAAVDGPWVAEFVESDDYPGCFDEVQVNAGTAATQWVDRETSDGTPFRIGTKPSSWFSTDRIVVRDTFSDDENECKVHAANAEYIATMQPDVGLAFADILDGLATNLPDWEPGRRAADLILGGESS